MEQVKLADRHEENAAPEIDALVDQIVQLGELNLNRPITLGRIGSPTFNLDLCCKLHRSVISA